MSLRILQFDLAFRWLEKILNHNLCDKCFNGIAPSKNGISQFILHVLFMLIF